MTGQRVEFSIQGAATEASVLPPEYFFRCASVDGSRCRPPPDRLPPFPADVRVEHVERAAKGVTVTSSDGHSAHFDDVVFACGAEEARRMLGKGATR